MFYDKHNYKGFYHIYKRIIESYYFKHLIKRLKRYIFSLFEILIESNEETRFLRKSQTDSDFSLEFLYDYHKFHLKAFISSE